MHPVSYPAGTGQDCLTEPYPDTPWSTGLVSNQSGVAKPASAWLTGCASCAYLRVAEDGFVDHVADHLAMLPTVEAVVLGGSRVQGTHRPDSDLDPGRFTIVARSIHRHCAKLAGTVPSPRSGNGAVGLQQGHLVADPGASGGCALWRSGQR